MYVACCTKSKVENIYTKDNDLQLKYNITYINFKKTILSQLCIKIICMKFITSKTWYINFIEQKYRGVKETILLHCIYLPLSSLILAFTLNSILYEINVQRFDEIIILENMFFNILQEDSGILLCIVILFFSWLDVLIFRYLPVMIFDTFYESNIYLNEASYEDISSPKLFNKTMTDILSLCLITYVLIVILQCNIHTYYAFVIGAIHTLWLVYYIKLLRNKNSHTRAMFLSTVTQFLYNVMILEILML